MSNAPNGGVIHIFIPYNRDFSNVILYLHWKYTTLFPFCWLVRTDSYLWKRFSRFYSHVAFLRLLIYAYPFLYKPSTKDSFLFVSNILILLTNVRCSFLTSSVFNLSSILIHKTILTDITTFRGPKRPFESKYIAFWEYTVGLEFFFPVWIKAIFL